MNMPAQKQTTDHWALGIAAAIGAHFIIGGILVATFFGLEQLRGKSPIADTLYGNVGVVLFGWFFGLGLSQIIYLVPLALGFRHFQMPRACAGVLISMGIVFLLSCACFGTFVFGLW
jgi:hypothetical protein